MTTKSTLHTYYYQVLLKKYIEAMGSITTKDDETGQTWENTCKLWIFLSSEITTGYVLAKDDDEAYKHAKADLLARFPEAKGYREHEHVRVKKIEEQVSEQKEDTRK